MLKWKRIDYWIREEVVSCQRLGIDHLKSIAFENLIEAEVTHEDYKGKVLHSIHNYDILSNQEYHDKLLYVPCVIPMRSAFVISPY